MSIAAISQYYSRARLLPPVIPLATLFVSPSGDDSVTYANNTFSNPWQTVGRAAWGSTNRAAPVSGEAAQAGDIVEVAAGTYVDTNEVNQRFEPTYNPVNNGSPSNLITFIANGAVFLESTHTSPSESNGQPIIGAGGKDYILWDGFILDEQNIETKRDTGPVVFFDCTGGGIQNCVITGFNVGRYDWADNHCGVRLELVSGVVMINNLITGYTPATGQDENYTALMTYDMQNSIIENNEISGNDAGMYIKGDRANSQPQDGNIIRYNHIHDNFRGMVLSGISDAENETGPFNQTLIYRNLIENCDRWGIYILQHELPNESEYPQFLSIANNTIVGTGTVGGPAELEDNGCIVFAKNNFSDILMSDVFIYNNISDGGQTSFNVFNNELNINTDAIDMDFNNFSDHVSGPLRANKVNMTLATWRTTFSKDANSTEFDPEFTNPGAGDYTLQGTSNLIDAGFDLLNLTGGGVGSAITIGCHIGDGKIIGRV